MTDPICDEPALPLPLETWLEVEIGRRFPDGAESLPPGRLRVRVCKLCFELLDRVGKEREAP